MQILRQPHHSRHHHSQNLCRESGFCSKINVNPSGSDCSFLIRNHILEGSPIEALRLYTEIRAKRVYILGIVPLILKACTSLSLANFGKALHAEAIKCGTHFDVLVGTSLVDMYAKCRDIGDARKLFDTMPQRNVVTCNAMIGGYFKNGDVKSASALFETMKVRSSVTWIGMIDGFAKISDTSKARELFELVPIELKNLVTWTVMVEGYCSNGEMDKAREVFERMPRRNFFAWSSMISGYCKNGHVNEAKSLFDKIPDRNLVNWNSMISGYVQNGFSDEAIELYEGMRAQGFNPDEVTAASILSACVQSGRLDLGREIHRMVIGKSIKCNQIVLNALVDMYAKCGDLETARVIFEGMRERNTACWNAMISGLSVHGQGKEALELFRRMERAGEREKPDHVTFLAVLSACAHGGSVDEGIESFSKMGKHGVEANVKHYGSLVDLLGRAGRLKEAYDLIKKMPVEPNETVLGAMLGACRVHLDLEMTERVVEEFGGRNSETGSVRIVHNVGLSNIYAASDRWEKAERLRMVMQSEGFQKTPGCSSIMP